MKPSATPTQSVLISLKASVEDSWHSARAVMSLIFRHNVAVQAESFLQFNKASWAPYPGTRALPIWPVDWPSSVPKYTKLSWAMGIRPAKCPGGISVSIGIAADLKSPTLQIPGTLPLMLDCEFFK